MEYIELFVTTNVVPNFARRGRRTHHRVYCNDSRGIHEILGESYPWNLHSDTLPAIRLPWLQNLKMVAATNQHGKRGNKINSVRLMFPLRLRSRFLYHMHTIF